MAESTLPSDALPSTRQLLKSTAIAAVVATVLLFTVVLPAEYGIDPTGTGRALGLAKMGEIKETLHREADAPAPRIVSPPQPCGEPTPATAATGATAASATRDDVTLVTLAPGQGREFKLAMRAGARATYTWVTDRGVVNYDAHADATNKAEGAISYKKGTGVSTDAGELVAAFDGWHGWFWRNRTQESLTITLTTRGAYHDVKEMK